MDPWSRRLTVSPLRVLADNMSIEPDVSDWLMGLIGELAARQAESVGEAVLHVRRPLSGVAYTRPLPGSKDANVGTEMDSVTDPQQQGALMDELLVESGGRPL